MKKFDKKLIVPMLIITLIIILIIFYLVFFKEEIEKNNAIHLLEESIEIEYGNEHKIDFVTENDENNNNLIWSSSNPEILDVNSEGVITFHKNEDAVVTITVQTENGKHSSSVEVKVNKVDNPIKVTGIELTSESEITLKRNETTFVSAKIIPENATNKQITWTSSNPELVSIDNNGKVVAKGNKNTQVILTAKSNEGGFSKTIIVNLKQQESEKPDNSIILNETSLSLKYGDVYKFIATITSESSTNNNISWTSSDPSLVSVDNNGMIKVIDNRAGEVIITAKLDNGNSAIAKVKINTIEIEKISLDKDSLKMSLGDYYKLNITVTPSNLNSELIKFSSSNENVVKVNENGLLLAQNVGTAIITAKSSNNKTAQVTVSVSNPNEITSGYLRTNGTKIVDGNGKQIVLRGFNLGAWFSRSYSMSSFVPLADSEESFNATGYSCINNESFYEALTDNKNKFNNSQIQNLSNTLYNNFITEEDFDLIAQTGANVIRLPIEYTYFTLLSTKMNVDFEKIDWAIAEAKKRGIYVIIDLHLVEGRQNSGGWCTSHTFFKNETYQKNALDLWGHIAYRYKNEIAVAGYDILNEPETTINKLVDFYDKAYKTIRKYDNNHIIIMEENCVVCGHAGANKQNSIGDLPDPKTKGWTNVVYSIHDYPNLDSNTKNDDSATLPNVLLSRLTSRLNLVKQKMLNYNIPYYVGEFSYLGTTQQRNSNNALYRQYLCAWNCAMDKYDELGLSYTPWTYKANHELYYGLIFYGTTKEKADLLNDDYNKLLTKFSYSSKDNMRFNEDFYLMFLNRFQGRIVEKIQLSNSNLLLNKGETKTVNYTIFPNTAIDKQIIWKSSNPSVASVNEKTGQIIAKSPGTATITAMHNSPFNKYIDSKDIYYCSNKLQESLCNCNKEPSHTNLNFTIEAAVTVTVK